MRALRMQLEDDLARFHVAPKSICTLFIGGGTPSCICASLYEPIFDLLEGYMSPDAEMTTEANPNSATKEWLERMYKLGINRVSFGVQSFNRRKLKLLNRAHSPKQAKEALFHAAEVGFTNLSLDLIYAVIGDTKELLQQDIDEAFELPINHLSAYALTIEENTPFADTPKMSQEYIDTTRWLFATIQAKGFGQYEISNFGRYKSRHNLGYWNYEDYIGAGSGAVGKIGNKRLYPLRDIEAYIHNPLTKDQENLTKEDMRFERIFLGLRSEVGIEKEILTPHELAQAKTLCQEGKLIESKRRFFNTDFLLADEIALFLSNF